jgi:PST family polysaccharide transporter
MLAFNVASWPTALMGSMINTVAMPAFSRLRHDPARLAEGVAQSTRAIALIAFPVAALTLALAAPLIHTVYGAQWVTAAPVLQALAAYGAVSILCLLFGNLLVGEGHPRLLLFVQIAWLAVLAPAMIIGVRIDGINGAGIAHVIVIVIVVLPAYLYALKRWSMTGPRTLVWPVIVPLAGAVAAGGAAWLMSEIVAAPALRLLCGGIAGVLVYFVVMAPVLSRYAQGRMPANRHLSLILRAYGRFGQALSSGLAFGGRRLAGEQV